MVKPFIEFDHSGDIGIEARGGDLAELMKNMTRGLFALMYRGTVREERVRRVRIQSSCSENLLIDWLCEVLALSAVHGELYGAIYIKKIRDDFIDALLKGEKLDPARHELRFEVKAATYHELRMERQGDDLIARVIFDL
ncbi:MAG: archease [Candidatus Latescibacterota bacterium]